MPCILVVNGYQISIWSNENNEPIHIHISKRKPSKNSTKLWLLSNGTFVKANINDNRIPNHELNKLIAKLTPQAKFIRDFWIAFHGYEKYYR